MLVLASLPLSGRLVTCPWYWEYHSVEFSVPASVENLELSVPTLLVLTFYKENPLICIRMQGKRLFFAQTVLTQNLKNTSRKFPHSVLGSGAVKKLVESKLFPIFLPQQNRFLRTTNFQEEKPGKYCVQAAEVNEVKEVSSLCSLGEVKGQ